MEELEILEEDVLLQPSQRSVLAEQNSATPTKTTNPDEMIIVQRGPRRKPIIWSPVDCDRSKILAPPKEKTPEPLPKKKCEINPRLRRRLVMSPSKGPSEYIGAILARKLKAAKNIETSKL